eukprot:CFRG8123T1
MTDKVNDLDMLDGIMEDLVSDMDAAGDPNHVGTCAKCRGSIPKNEQDKSCIVRERMWHNACFTCEECAAPLRDTGYYAHPTTNALQCQDCQVKATCPKCNICDKFVSEKKVEYEGKPYHPDCFLCNSCKEPLLDKQFIPRAEDKTNHCASCFHENFTDKCEDCHKPIIADKPGFTYSRVEDRKWHVDCFMCEGEDCRKKLDPSAVLMKDNKIFCAEHHRAYVSKLQTVNDEVKAETITEASKETSQIC